MRIEQQRSLGKQRLRVWEEACVGTQSDFREQMLLHNEIEGLLNFEVICENGNKVYEFSVSGFESLRSYCEHNKLEERALQNVLGSILKTIYRGREFMLLENDYVINPETVFVSSDSKIYIAYYSGFGQDLREQLRALAEFLMDNIEYKSDDAVLLVYGFYMQTKDENSMIEDLLASILQNENRTAKEDSQSYEMNQSNAQGQGEVYESMGDSFDCNSSEVGQTQSERFFKFERKTKADRQTKSERKTKSEGLINSERQQISEKQSAPEEEEFKRRREASQMVDALAFKEINSDGDEKIGALQVIRSSPLRLKLISLLVPIAVFAVEVLVYKLGLMTNSVAGKVSVLKLFAFAVAGLGIIVGTERSMWSRFAKNVAQSIRSARARVDEATVLLCENGTVKYPFSLVSDEYPSICVSRFPYFVGKEAANVDYVLDRVGVSRYHMRIDKEGDNITIADLSSTNGTYINGTRLTPYKAVQIRRGDEVTIGVCRFYCN